MKIPEGWQLVPVEPTQEMCDVGDQSACAYDVYKFMLEAAPTPPVGQEPEFSDGCDSEGFPGGCERFGHTVETCPTPPAQEDEPVAWGLQRVDNGIIIYWSHDKKSVEEHLTWDTPYQAKTQMVEVYTRPDNGELRKAAEEVLRIWDEEFDDATFERAIENLRNALKGKS